MCGIAGFLSFKPNQTRDLLQPIGEKMSDALIHRGPDDSGIWTDEENMILLAHRRLSILDLSPSGHQPMFFPGGRYVLIFNGEIYNCLEIREELKKLSFQFKGHSDTEAMLAAFETWGVVESLKKFIGMFAAALWDKKEKELFLIRDRMGKKPLYYGFMGDTFLFGSELKALKAHPQFRGTISRSALTAYLRYSYIPTPYSIYENIYKLPPGAILTLNPVKGWDKVKIETYWSFKEITEKNERPPSHLSEERAAEDLELLLLNAAKLRMYSDVPLGVFLSGGIDSSLVAALMQAQSKTPIKTFTIGFQEAGYNEAQYARDIAERLGTEHTEFYLSPKETMDVIPLLPDIYDEPFADPSQIPTYLVSKLAKQQVTVVLSGDGGDEIFGGYNRYLIGKKIWKKISRLPAPIKKLFSKTITGIPPRTLDSFFSLLGSAHLPLLKEERPGEKLHKLTQILNASSCEEIYYQIVSQWKEPESIVINGNEPPNDLKTASWNSWMSCAEKMMAWDTLTYLPDDILAKVDRASMAVSLEVRAPILDHRVVEYAWRLPIEMRIQNGKTKWILRKILYKHVPKELIERPKMGFGLPIGEWIRGPLRGWTESLLNLERLKNEDYFYPEPILEKWNEHLSGKKSWTNLLWNILMFEIWLHKNG